MAKIQASPLLFAIRTAGRACLLPSDQKKHPQKHNRAHQISGADEVEWGEDEEQRQDIENTGPGWQGGGSGEDGSEENHREKKQARVAAIHRDGSFLHKFHDSTESFFGAAQADIEPFDGSKDHMMNGTQHKKHYRAETYSFSYQ